ncbi:MAG: adenylosuccinate lyase [Gammaproteobacteria bacterium]|nr:adenylosuccinate lyase [Gammaproteobacteria bacterium]
MTDPTLTALSPLDGRYAGKCADVAALFSEAALIGFRVQVEARWLLHLARDARLPELAALGAPVVAELECLSNSLPEGDAARVKAIESRTNHDVKAVEYYLRDRLQAVGASAAELEFIHFACTSEDINNLAYALMLDEARRQVLLPLMEQLRQALRARAHAHAELPMLSRTHGQPASPTTLGKEMANVAHRLAVAQGSFASVNAVGKINGAVGNFNAHAVACPEVDWPAVARRFVESLGLEYNPYTIQIEPHDWIAEYCDALARYHTVLIDFARDAWGYISVGYFRQRTIAGEVGSSTMPHKVNPIDFENAEGNAGLANALLGHFSEKLPISRWQRDLTDSTVLRNLGVAIAHGVLALRSLTRGLSKLDPDPVRLAADLDANWEVLGEAIQTVMRRHGVPDAYDRLKDFTRGRRVGAAELREFVATLPIPAEAQARLIALTPAAYTGLASRLAREV